MSGRWVFPLESRKARDPRLAGGKAAGLARLAGQGYPIPPGFVIGIPALRHYSRKIFRRLRDRGEDISPRLLDEIREQILAAPFPRSLESAIRGACRARAGAWAVRSSMFGEDSQKSSFAGLLDTCLNVSEPSEVVQAVRKCVASMCNWRLWSYQLESGRSWKLIRKMMAMAVIVQEMIEARVSGVAFGADPNTGCREVIIEAVPGTGENLVHGRAAPHRFILKDRTHLEYLPPQDAGAPCLEERDVFRLAEAVREISARAGSPQDVEWVFDGRDFRFLQCRPITALPTQRVYSSRMVSEMSPGLITPLMWSTKTRSKVRSVFGRIATELVGPNHMDFAKSIKRIHSRLYADMTAFGEFLGQLGLPANFFEMITRHEGPRRRRSLFRGVKIYSLPRLLRFIRRYSRPAGEMGDFIDSHRRALEPYRRTAWDTLSPEGLLDRFDRLLKLHAKTQWHMFVGPMNMTMRYRLLGRLLARRVPGINPGELLIGIDGLTALQPNAELMSMAALALKLPPDIREFMLQGKTSELQAGLGASEEGRALLARFHDFLDRFGFLSANGSDFTAIPWAEDPGPVWQSIGRFARQAEAGGSLNVPRPRRESLSHVRNRLSLLQRLVFGRLWESTRRYMELREATSLIMSEETYLMRRALMTTASHLERQGSIESASDIFYLYHDELRERLAGRISDKEIRHRIAQRKEEMKRDAGIELPETFCGELAQFGPSVSDTDEFLSGISGSPGRAHGTARVVLDPSRLQKLLTAEDILVVPFTDVGWTPLLPGIRGIVAETGGQLSHTSIIAREYGLPAVVSVKDATRLIKDGQLITIDGSRGRVYRHPGAQIPGEGEE